jgi:hypothetical protein
LFPGKKKNRLCGPVRSEIGRGGEIRTHGLLYPKQARYQTAPRPDNNLSILETTPFVNGDFQKIPRFSGEERLLFSETDFSFIFSIYLSGESDKSRQVLYYIEECKQPCCQNP